MASSREREAARLGMEILDQVLMDLGDPPVRANPYFHVADPVVGNLPNIIVDKQGTAPLRFVFGQDLDVWVGPFSEVVLLTVAEDTRNLVYQQVERVLLSSVECHRGEKSMVISLRLFEAKPWLSLKVRATGLVSDLKESYAPYSARSAG